MEDFKLSADLASKKIDEMDKLLSIDLLHQEGLVSGTSFRFYLQNIDENYFDDANRRDIYQELKTKTDKFRYQHVEVLLDQAADLLERGIRSREEWNENRVTAFNLVLDLYQFSELDKIHQDEITAGYYELPYKISSATLEAERAQHAGFQEENLSLKKEPLLQENGKPFRRFIREAARNAWAGGLPAYIFAYSNQGERTESYPEPNFVYADADGRTEISERVYNHLQHTAEFRAQFDVESLQNNLLREIERLDAQEKASQKRQEALTSTRDYDYLDTGTNKVDKPKDDNGNEITEEQLNPNANGKFRYRRMQVERDIYGIKIHSVASPGSALAYLERLDAAKTRFDRDFKDALARLLPAAEGLEKLYGFDNPLPALASYLLNPDYLLNEQVPHHFFDDCLNWVREAISFLIRFAQLEQSYVVPISIRKLVGEDQWELGKRNGYWDRITIPDAYFEDAIMDQRHVRIRGLSAFVVEQDKSQNLWQVTVQVPALSHCKHLRTLTDIDTDIVRLIQDDVPPVRLSRVQARDSIRQPDSAGIQALHNASPMGDFWKVVINPIASAGETGKLDSLKDVHLDLHVVMRNKTD